MAVSSVPNLDENLDTIFDRFIQIPCTHMAVIIDTDSQQKFQFKLYLVTAPVLFTTLSRNLGYKQDDPDFTVGTTEEICHKILMNMKDKLSYVQCLDRKDVLLVRILNQFAKEKIKKLSHKLLMYHHMTDLYNYDTYDC